MVREWYGRMGMNFTLPRNYTHFAFLILENFILKNKDNIFSIYILGTERFTKGILLYL